MELPKYTIEKTNSIGITKELKMIHTHLKIHITAVCTFPVFDADNIRSEVTDFSTKTMLILKNERFLSQDDKDILSSINKLVKVLYYMVEERNILQKKLLESYMKSDGNSKYSKGQKIETQEVQPFKFDIETQASLYKKNKIAESKKKERLSKDKLQVLEQWYTDNYEHPYLTVDSTISLVEKTGLSSTQIRNWYVMLLLILRG